MKFWKREPKPKPPYRVRYINMFELIYEEGDHHVSIYTEGPPGDAMLNRLSLVHWSTPHEHELISVEKRDQILERVLTEMGKKGFQYRVYVSEESEERLRRKVIESRDAENQNISG